jgi:hypothetical protein
LPLHYTEVPDLKNAEQKGAPKQYGITTRSRIDPNPRELKRAFSKSNPARNQSRSGHQIAGASLPHQILLHL